MVFPWEVVSDGSLPNTASLFSAGVAANVLIGGGNCGELVTGCGSLADSLGGSVSLGVIGSWMTES